MNRTLPHSLESESNLLACALLDGNEVLGRALAAGITAASFYETKHAVVFDCLRDMMAAGKPLEPSVLMEELRTSRQLDAVGGHAFIVQISGLISTTAQATYFIEKVREQAQLREMIRATNQLIENCYAYAGGGIAEVFAEPLERLLMATGAAGSPEPTWPQTIDSADQTAGELIANKGKALESMIEFPWRQMNELFGPMIRGQLVVVAARPSIGKSSLARPFACHAAMQGRKVYFDTLEVQPERVALQMAATISRVGVRQLGTAHVNDQNDFRVALRSLKNLGFTMSRRDRSLAQIVGRCKALHSQGKIDLAVIDHGGYITEIATASAGEKVSAVGRVTKALKNLAVDLNIPVILLWQLNRGSEKDNNREPVLSDLKDSGSVEEDSDKVIFIHRPTANPLTGLDQPSTSHVTDCPRFFQNVIQAKGRDEGGTFVSFYFNRATATFDPIQK